MDLDLLVVPLTALSDDPAALRDRLIAALRASVARSLPGRNVELTYDPDAQQFSIHEFVRVDPSNLERAGAICEVELGDELGFELWQPPTPDIAAFLGLDELTWSRFRDRAERAVRMILTEGRRERERAAFEPWLAQNRDALAAWRRTAWRPLVAAAVESTGWIPGTTYYGGPAWLRDDEPWPACSACKAPMEPLLHLDMAASPFVAAELPAYEIFQCTVCRVGELAKAVDAHARPRPSPISDPVCAPKAVIGWQAVDDYSGFAASDPAFEAQMALRGDKLGGWPARLQGTREEPFPCPACGGDTLLSYQLDSDSHAEWTWGDLGRAWLGACPRHPTRPTYFWECS
jgi:hypothetical protein